MFSLNKTLICMQRLFTLAKLIWITLLTLKSYGKKVHTIPNALRCGASELISLQHFVFVIPCCIDSVVILKIHLSQNLFLLWQLEFVTPMDKQSMRYCCTTMGSVGILSWVCKMQRSFFASYFWRQQLNIYVGQLVVGKCHSFVKHRGQLVVDSVINWWNTRVSW